MLCYYSGYMSSEYAMKWLFSIEVDVYSFGVLMLEIITGRKNIGYYKEKQDSNLVGHVKMNQIIMWQIYMLIFL